MITEGVLLEQVPQCGYCQSGQIMSAAVSAIGGPPYSLQVGNDNYGELKPISTIPRADSLCPSPKPDERL